MNNSVTGIFFSKKIQLEIAPGLVFLTAYLLADLMFSAICLLIATLVCSVMAYRDFKRVPVLPVITIVLLSVLTLLSFIFTSPDFIKFRATISYCLFAFILLLSLKRPKTVLQKVLDDQLSMQRTGWEKATIAWAVLNTIFAVLNEVVWRTQNTTFWVAFDSIALPCLILLYIYVTRYYAQKYWLEEKASC